MKKIVPAPASTGVLESQPSAAGPNGGHRKSKNRVATLERSRRDEGNGHTDQSQNEILRALTALKKGHFIDRLPLHWQGVSGKIADTFNELAELMEHSTQ